MRLTEKDKERFWSKVDIRGEDECWEWKSSLNSQGYGNLSIGGRRRTGGTVETAHRIAYTISIGEIPSGLLVRHLCNNKPCCNPKHLATGTMKDNGQDLIKFNKTPEGIMRKKPRVVVRIKREGSLRPGRKIETHRPLVGFKAEPKEYEFIQSLIDETQMTNRQLIMAALHHYQAHLIKQRAA